MDFKEWNDLVGFWTSDLGLYELANKTFMAGEEIGKRKTLETIKKRRSFFTNLLNWISYRIVRLALIIATYLPHRRFKNYR